MNAKAIKERESFARAQLEAEQSVLESRENAMALAFLLVLAGWSAASYAVYAKRRNREDKRVMVAGGVAGVAFILALLFWFTRPGLGDIDERVAQIMDEDDATGPYTSTDNPDGTVTYMCTIDVERSRITGTRSDDISFEWSADGCVNGRTQYGFSAGRWSRILVPQDEDTVAINSFDSDSATFRIDRYLMRRDDITKARNARAQYKAPSCSAEDAGNTLGAMQESVSALLPDRPNERLSYSCERQSGDR